MNDRTKKLLEERGSRYGNFKDLANISQALKEMWYMEENIRYKEPTNTMNEAMEMVLHKLARVMNGDRYYLDNIDDMIGYLELYREEIIKNNINTNKKEESVSEAKHQINRAINENDNREDLEPEIIETIEDILNLFK